MKKKNNIILAKGDIFKISSLRELLEFSWWMHLMFFFSSQQISFAFTDLVYR